jgi:Protein of unknown function (DUF5818)
MCRKTSLFAAVLIASTPFLFGQELQDQPSPRVPDDLAPQQLIAWSGFQKPKPVPQPLPPPDTPVPQPEPQAPQPPDSQSSPESPGHPTQTFTGKIVKAGDKYVLRVASNSSYQLDEQSGLKQYEDKNVKVVGTLDAGTNTIRVVRIDLLS